MPKSYFPLHVHSHFSLLDGLSKPEDISNRCEEIGVEGSSLTDHGSISGHIQFLKKMGKAGKKALLGCEFYVCKEDAEVKEARNKRNAHLCVIAKNDDGWRDMVQMVSESNKPEHYYYKPRLDLDRIFKYASRGNIMAYSGHIGSNMANILYDNDGNLSSNWRAGGCSLAKKFAEAFGKENFFLEVQRMDHKLFPMQDEIADCVRQISKDTGISCVASQDAHYASKEDAIDQRILLCAQLGRITLKQLAQSRMGGFSRSKQYHIPSFEEMKEWHTDAELENTLLFASRVSEYKKILKNPILPKFDCPGGIPPEEYLRTLCREGWNRKVQGVLPQKKHGEYAQRVERELGVLLGAGLSSYFLIVADIINFVRSKGWLPGPGRGSAAGSLVSYLVGITSIDPIKYDLLFERFYNAGRNTEGHTSMPDIDMDIPKYAREHVINYIRNKYGGEYVGQMITFQTMKGRNTLKDVFRAHGNTDFSEMNKITKNIIEEHKISDELQKMKEDTGESSIIKWCLENTPKKLDEWCRIDDEGNLSGPYASRFAQAIRLEGTKSNQSKHAAGLIIAPEPLRNMFPMVLDKETNLQYCGFEMEDADATGGLKFDALGVTALDKSMAVAQDLLTGEIHEVNI